MLAFPPKNMNKLAYYTIEPICDPPKTNHGLLDPRGPTVVEISYTLGEIPRSQYIHGRGLHITIER